MRFTRQLSVLAAIGLSAEVLGHLLPPLLAPMGAPEKRNVLSVERDEVRTSVPLFTCYCGRRLEQLYAASVEQNCQKKNLLMNILKSIAIRLLKKQDPISSQLGFHILKRCSVIFVSGRGVTF